MRQLLLIVAAAYLPLAAGSARAADKAEPKGDKVEYELHGGYLERVDHASADTLADKDTHGLLSFFVLADQDAFEKAFGKDEGGKVDLLHFIPNGDPKGKKNALPKDAFDKKMVVGAIRRGGNMWTYKVTKATADGDTLYVQYEAASSNGYPNSYSSPLIVSVDKGKYSSVVFIENGKKLGTADVPKEQGKDK